MDDFGNGFDSYALVSRIEDIEGGVVRYWLFVLSGYEELDSKQSLYYEILLRGEAMPYY